MNEVLLYSVLALLVLVGALVLVRRRPQGEKGRGPAIPSGRGLISERQFSLAKRIFDSMDFCWLRDEMDMPDLARALARDRKRMALELLRMVEGSFKELLRTPVPLSAGGHAADHPGSWGLLRLTLRFHLLLTYAKLVIWVYGPYHRMVPSFSWLRVFRGGAVPGKAYQTADLHRLH